MKLNRIIYFCYYIKKLNRPLFHKFMAYVKQQTGRNSVNIWLDIFRHSLKYNTSILEYFQFGFYKPDCSEEEKSSWAGTGFMYEFQKYMNPPQFRYLLEDKTVFDKTYGKYMHHLAISVEDLKSDNALIKTVLNNRSGKVVFKIKDGGCGKRVQVEPASSFTESSLVKYMEDNHFDLVEEFVQQHDVINQLAPTALNTVRIITQLRPNGNVDIVGCRLRISVHGVTDNLAAGNIAAFIDPKTGIITGPGIYSDITKSETEYHPVTGVKITGLKIPYWDEALKMVKELAVIDCRNKSIGWDLAITSYGPDLIEGNREWCKLLYQLPVQKGLKSVLETYRKEYN